MGISGISGVARLVHPFTGRRTLHTAGGDIPLMSPNPAGSISFQVSNDWRIFHADSDGDSIPFSFPAPAFPDEESDMEAVERLGSKSKRPSRYTIGQENEQSLLFPPQNQGRNSCQNDSKLPLVIFLDRFRRLFF